MNISDNLYSCYQEVKYKAYEATTTYVVSRETMDCIAAKVNDVCQTVIDSVVGAWKRATKGSVVDPPVDDLHSWTLINPVKSKPKDE